MLREYLALDWVQVVAGIVVILFALVISNVIMSADRLIKMKGKWEAMQKRTNILNGYIDASDVVSREWNTVNPESVAFPFLDVGRSVNRIGGTQFTYSFWMYVENLATIHQTPKNMWYGNSKAVDDGYVTIGGNRYYLKDNPPLYPLLIKGDRHVYNYSRQSGIDLDYVQGRYVMSPMIAIGNPKFKEICVLFNSVDRVDCKISVKRSPSIDSTLRHNLSSITEQSWVMYTFVFSDLAPETGFESGIVVKTYINDTLYQLDKLNGVLRDNDGNLTLLPNGAPGTDSTSPCKVMLSTMDYYNYAMSDDQVTRRYNAGYSTVSNSDVNLMKNKTINFGIPNKLDIYNA